MCLVVLLIIALPLAKELKYNDVPEPDYIIWTQNEEDANTPIHIYLYVQSDTGTPYPHYSEDSIEIINTRIDEVLNNMSTNTP